MRAASSVGYYFLRKQVLEEPCDLRLQNASVDNVRFYQALFSDNDFCPWE